MTNIHTGYTLYSRPVLSFTCHSLTHSLPPNAPTYLVIHSLIPFHCLYRSVIPCLVMSSNALPTTYLPTWPSLYTFPLHTLYLIPHFTLYRTHQYSTHMHLSSSLSIHSPYSLFSPISCPIPTSVHLYPFLFYRPHTCSSEE